MTTRHLHVMAEYGEDTFPVWERTRGAEAGPVDPTSLNISQELKDALAAWNGVYARLPATNYRFESARARREWIREGRALARRFQAEVGDDVRVTFQA